MITTDLMQHSDTKWLILGVREKNVVQSKIFANFVHESYARRQAVKDIWLSKVKTKQGRQITG